MQNDHKVAINILFTESQSSFLNVNAPHIDHFDPEDSNVCLITSSDFKKSAQKEEQTICKEITPKVSERSRQIYCKLATGQIAFYAMSFGESSSFLQDSNESFTSPSEPKSLFEAISLSRINLGTVRSRAHSGNLRVSSNEIFVDLIDYENNEEAFCRICRGGDSQENLLTPCRCRGTMALVHLSCLERWLKESNNFYCELCQHRYSVTREPQYGILRSIFQYLSRGFSSYEVYQDFLYLVIYTPILILANYVLLLICEEIIRADKSLINTSSQILSLAAVLGMAIIDFTYFTWLLLTIQKHHYCWRCFYRNSTLIKLVLSKVKQRPFKNKAQHEETD